MSRYCYPEELKKLKACVDCHLVKTQKQFNSEGCNNCGYKGPEMVDKSTSKFKGIIAITDPKKSWAAKYLGKSKKNIFFNNNIIGDYVPGFYCLSIYQEDNDDEDMYK